MNRDWKTEAERLRDEGMRLAADSKMKQVVAGQLAMLQALLLSRDGTATIDDATLSGNLAKKFVDGGRWRGSVTRSLAKQGLIEATGEYRRSIRPSRHRAPNAVWRLLHRFAATQLVARLQAVLAATATGDAKDE